MGVAPFPTLARAVSRITPELWLAFGAPVARGELRSAEVGPATHVIDAREAIPRAADLVELWLAIEPELSCCQVQVGLQLYADGELWTGGICGHFQHLGGWALLGLDLAQGRASSTLVGDESALRTRIDGDRAMIWDEHALARGTRERFWPIRCERLAMARAIAEGGALVDTLRHRVIEALAAGFDRGALPARVGTSHPLRGRSRLDKAAVVDHEVARHFDTLALRELAARLRAP